MEKLERYLRFMREAERLKDVLRSARTSTGTARKHGRTLVAAGPAGRSSSPDERPRNWTCLGSLSMCLVHDLGEAYDGDIPAVAQMRPPAPRRRRSWRPWSRLTRLLPARGRSTAIRTLWEEYEACADARGAVGEGARQGRDHPPAQPGCQSRRFRLRVQPDLRRRLVVPRRRRCCADLRRLLDDETRRHIGPEHAAECNTGATPGKTRNTCRPESLKSPGRFAPKDPDAPNGQALSIRTTSACGSSAPKTACCRPPARRRPAP